MVFLPPNACDSNEVLGESPRVTIGWNMVGCESRLNSVKLLLLVPVQKAKSIASER